MTCRAGGPGAQRQHPASDIQDSSLSGRVLVQSASKVKSLDYPGVKHSQAINIKRTPWIRHKDKDKGEHLR